MRGLRVGALATYALAALVVGGSSTSSAASCSTEPAHDVSYTAIEGVDPTLLSLDVSPVPGSCAAPVAVWVHGGGWRNGDKSLDAETRAAFYNEQGWVLVSVNYRLVVLGVEPAVRYPEFNEDVASALAWVRDEIGGYGGDPGRVVLVGHSAGAGIAAAVIADPRYLEPHGLAPDWIDCAVLLDTEGYDVATMAERGGQLGDVYRNAFGDDPAVWADASPSSHVGDGPLPSRVVVVTRGSPRRITSATAFGDQLRFAGADVTVADVNPLSHADVNRLIGTGDATMTPLMTETLNAL